MLVSVIIPIYNVATVLQKSLDSVRAQTFQDLEVILVNDGSTDGSEKVAEVFVEQDDRFQIIHQRNAGLSAARNSGLKQATGDYVFYLDSDDYLIEDCIEVLLQAVTEHQAEIAQANFYYDYPGYLLYNNNLNEGTVCLDKEAALQKLLEQREMKNFAWGKLIRTDIARQYTFPEGKYFEDTFWKYKIVHACTRYVMVGKPMLYYLQRGESISGRFSMRHLDQLEGYADRLAFIKAKDGAPRFQKAMAAFNRLILQHQYLLKKATGVNKEVYQEALDHYIDLFDLKKQFPWSHIVAKYSFLHGIQTLYQRIKGRFFNSSRWVRIEKPVNPQIRGFE